MSVEAATAAPEAAPAAPAAPEVTPAPPASQAPAAPADNTPDLPPPPAIQRDTDPVPGGVSSEPTPEGQPAPEVPPTRAQQLSDALGIDLTQFSSEADAEVAARILVEGYAASGLNSQPAPPTPGPPAVGPPQPQQNTAPAPAEVPELPDLEDVDPKVAAYLKQLTAESQQRNAELERYRQQQAQYAAQQRQQQDLEIAQRAHAAIDGWADAQYGTGQTATFAQQIARRNLLSTADAIINGMTARGQRVPTVERVIEMARLLQSGPTAPAAAQPPALGTPAPPVPQAPKAPMSPFSRDRVKVGTPNYTDDPQALAEAKAILSRSRA